MRKFFLLVCVIFLVLLLTGCRTTETVYVQPEPIDISPSLEVLFDSRPDDNRIDIVLDITTIDDVVYNSAQYLKAWELWETYALGLEDYLLELEQMLSDS